MTIRLTTRSRATAEAIRDLVPFRTSSPNFYGEAYDNAPSYLYGGYLRGGDAEALSRDLNIKAIDYVVWSYSTPIAWHVGARQGEPARWHIVSQSFSVTTSKHQGNLYMCGERYPRPNVRWLGMKGGVNQGYELSILGVPLAHADTRESAHTMAHRYYLNGVTA